MESEESSILFSGFWGTVQNIFWSNFPDIVFIIKAFLLEVATSWYNFGQYSLVYSQYSVK